MRALSDVELLDLWDAAFFRHPLDRALLALAAAMPEANDELADWPIGRRNQALARLHCYCFGKALEAWTACPQCTEKLEFEMNAQLIAGGDEPVREPRPVQVIGLRFRVPTSRDLALALGEPDASAGAVRIAESCLLDWGNASPEKRPKWSAEALAEVGEQLALADPMAETRLQLDCPGCGYQWRETLDIAHFLWTKIQGRARQLLVTIHTLASAYGWSQAEILSLSDNRRAMYMELAQS